MHTAAVDVRRAGERFRTRTGWLESHHSFSFGHHHDPANVGHGLLLVLNDDRVAPGQGFGTHGHRDMEIVTWVLSGALEHRDSTGNEGVIRPGTVQRMSAGTGIRHSEMNHSSTEPVHLLQMWVPPDTAGIDPGYEELDVSPGLRDGSLVPVASGRGHEGAVRLRQAGAVMWVSRLHPTGEVLLPDAPFVHLFVARGAVTLDRTPLAQGDAARLTGAGPLSVATEVGAEIVVWESDTAVTR
jgi:quercetin 2,3-dioxygenase